MRLVTSVTVCERLEWSLVDMTPILRRRWRVVAASVVLGALASLALTWQMSESYRAEAQLFVAIAPGSTDDSAGSLSEASYVVANRVPSYPGLVTSPRVLGPVIDELGLDTTPAELAGRVAAQVPPGTALVEVYADADSAEESAELANAVADQLVEVVETLDRPRPDGDPVVRLTPTRDAVAPDAPRSPVPAINLGAGLVAGLLLGAGGALLRDTLDATVRGVADAETAGLPVLAEVPLVRRKGQPSAVAAVSGTAATWAESFRRLRLALDRQLAVVAAARGEASLPSTEGPAPRTVLVVGADRGAGGTTSAVHLAASHAAAGRRTVLVDADLHAPATASLLGLEPGVGLTTALAGHCGLDGLAQRVGGLDVVAAGPRPPNPAELVASNAFADLLARLATAYDAVVVDAPPLSSATDAVSVARVADAVVVVCRHRHTRLVDLHRGLTDLRDAGAPVVGAVLTGMPGDHRATRPAPRHAGPRHATARHGPPRHAADSRARPF